MAKKSARSTSRRRPKAPPTSPPAAPATARRNAPGNSPSGEQDGDKARAHWTFLTNHSHVLILLSRNPTVVLREVAASVGITERAVQRIIADLEEVGVIRREKVGRQNKYQIRGDQPLRHPIESHRTIGDLVRLMDDSAPRDST